MPASSAGRRSVSHEGFDRSTAFTGSSAPETGGSGLDLATISRALVHRRWLIAGATSVGLILGIIVTLLTTFLYRATVTLEVNPPTVQVADSKSSPVASNGAGYDLITTQIGLLKSRSIAERTARELNLVSNNDLIGPGGSATERLQRATSIIASGIDVKAPEAGSLINFSYTSHSPRLAAAVANQVADSFINSELQRRYDASSYARKFLSEQIIKTRGDLERSERQLVSYAQAQGIINTSGPSKDGGSPGDVSSLQGESLVALNGALGSATAKRMQAESAYREGTAVGATTDVTASTAGLRSTRAGLQAEYQQKRAFMKPDHPEMLSLQSQINEIDRQIVRESSQASFSRNNSLQSEYRSAAASERALSSKVSALKESVLNLRGRSIEYNILQRDADTNRTLYDALLQRYKEVGVAAGIGSSPVSIVDRAEVPAAPFRPNLWMNLAFGFLAGLVAGIGAAVALDILFDTIKTNDDIRVKLRTACLGAIPKITVGEFSESLKKLHSETSEAYASVLASLRLSTDEGLPRTLMVTSTRASEGKSSSSSALAQNLARLGRKVLLIDGDLRKPAFRSLNESLGLTHLLTGEARNAAEHISATQFDNLFLLPAGPIPPNAADLLSSDRGPAVFRELEAHYDFLIVDAPPVMGFADALLLASITKNVLFIVEGSRTRTKGALESLELLRNTGAHVLGAVLTKTTGDMGGYGYYGHNLDRTSVEKNPSRNIIMFPNSAETNA